MMRPQTSQSVSENVPDSSEAAAYLGKLNEAQRDAVLTPPNQALQVLAGAGTGKTELISHRFIKLLRDLQHNGTSSPQERILVVTFTNDAARSMRERIHQRLLSNGEDGLTPDAWISTFHQFCIRLLRTHPLEVGLPPDFSTLNALEQRVLFSRVTQSVLAGDYGAIEEVLSAYHLMPALPADVLALESLSQSGLEDLETLLDPGVLYGLVNRIKTAGLSPSEFRETARSQAIRLTECLKTLPTPHEKDLDGVGNIELKLSAWRDALSGWAYSEWDPVKNAVEKAEKSGKKLVASMFKEELKGVSDLYLAPRTYAPLTPDFSRLDLALDMELKLIDIVAAVYALYQHTLLSQGACDFDDLINHSIALLDNHPTLRARYQAQFKAIIVDEFQDSNGSQLRLLELLMQEKAKNLTVVGDEKQSIYAFRFAQPENLDLIFRHGAYKKINLRVNYRSRPPVLSVANQLTTLLTRRDGQTLEPCPDLAECDQPKVVWVNLDASCDLESATEKPMARPIAEQKQQEARYIAVETARLVREEGRRFSDITVLVKSHAKAEEIERMLYWHGIPAVRQKNLGFFEEPVIKDSMSLLCLMRNLNEDKSLVRILQGKLNQKQIRLLMTLRNEMVKTGEAGSLFETCRRLDQDPERFRFLPENVREALGDLANRLERLRKLKHRLTPVQLFLRLGSEIGLIQAETPVWRQTRQRLTLRTFERLLYLFGQNQPMQPTLDEVIETLERYAADPNLELPVNETLSGEDAVRIMTVFAAKGLEFPVVFAAYTETARTSRPESAITFDPQYPGKQGFGLILGKVNGIGNLKREVYQKIWQAPRGQTEAQRVFYVALTRARERLYVIRGGQSFAWTDPDEFSGDMVERLSESRNGDILENTVWNADMDEIREVMTRLQENDRF